MPGTLYLLPTRLGEGEWQNVLPVETRATACRLRHFIVENAKTARAALKWLEHPDPLRDLIIEQLPATPSPTEINHLVAPLSAGIDIGLMSEAGCPGVADPGALIVRQCHMQGIPIKPMIGPSSLLLALMASGLDGQRFAFHGYLPAREPERSKRIAELGKESRHKIQTQLFIEAPYRNVALWEALLATCHPGTLLCLACDLTTATESVVTHSVTNWKKLAKPDIDRRPTVFLLLSAC